MLSTGTSIYASHNAAGQLNLYNPTGSGELTDQYLKDRAAMLTWKLQFGTHDTQPVGDTFVKPQGGTPFYFEDETTNTKIRLGAGDSALILKSHQRSWRNPERKCQPADIHQSDIALAALNAAKITACQPTFQRKPFLRDSPCTAQRGQVATKTQLGIIRKFARHAQMLETWALQGHAL